MRIAEAGKTGAATVMITGLAVGMQSVVIPLLAICAIIFVSTELAGLYGVGIAAVGLLATVGMTMAVDATGRLRTTPAASRKWPASARRRAPSRTPSTNSATRPPPWARASPSAPPALAALAIIAAFVETVAYNRGGDFSLHLGNPEVLIGLFIGGLTPFLIASITMTAVGDAAMEMIEEIRRQFREIPGLLEGTAKPDNAKCIDIATSAALKRMLLPGAIAVALPPVVGFGIGAQALGACWVVRCSLRAHGADHGQRRGAWDNAKKYVEKGNLGGKGSDVHAATVVGDTVGDPFKDTSGPSMNILINVMAIVSLVIAPLL